MVGDKGGAKADRKYNARQSQSLRRLTVKHLAEGKIDLAEAENRLHSRGLLSTRYRAQVAARPLVSAYKGAMAQGDLLPPTPEVTKISPGRIYSALKRGALATHQIAFPDPRSEQQIRRSGEAAKEAISTFVPGGYYATHPGRIKEEWNDPLAMALGSIPAERKLKQLYRGVKEVRKAGKAATVMNIAGRPKHAEKWKLDPRTGLFNKPGLASRLRRITNVKSIPYNPIYGPYDNWRTNQRPGSGEEVNRGRYPGEKTARDYIVGERRYRIPKGRGPQMNIVGPGGTPKNMPYGWKMPVPGHFERDLRNAGRTLKDRVSEPFEPNLTDMSGYGRHNFPDVGYTSRYHDDPYADFERKDAKSVILQHLLGQRDYGPVRAGSANIIGRSGGPKPAGSRWRLNPQGQPELHADLPFSQTTPHTTDFTARTQIPNKRDETRPWVHGQEELVDLKKNAEGQSFMSQLYAALGYPEMHSIPMPDDDIRDIGHAWYSPNIVGGRFNPTLSDQARRLAATLHQHRD